MNKEELRIVFMGTPAFAVESLRCLVEGGYKVVGVVTMPDKPAGRGMKLTYSPVKEYALKQNLPLLQPEKLRSEDFLGDLAALKADLQIVVAFRMLPELVWDMPRLGTFNLHASLLPQYRGAAPINWAIINGEKTTGVSTFFLSHEIDTGKILFREEVPIQENDTAGTVHDKLMQIGGQLVVKTVDSLLEGSYQAIDQSKYYSEGGDLRPAPKLFKEDGELHWNQPALRIHNRVRGLSPYPAAWTELVMPNGETLSLKVLATEVVPAHTEQWPVGTVLTDKKTTLEVVANDGLVRLLEIKPAGKRSMPTAEFLRGYRW